MPASKFSEVYLKTAQSTNSQFVQTPSTAEMVTTTLPTDPEIFAPGISSNCSRIGIKLNNSRSNLGSLIEHLLSPINGSVAGRITK
jgi:hypothetical protein